MRYHLQESKENEEPMMSSDELRMSFQIKNDSHKINKSNLKELNENAIIPEMKSMSSGSVKSFNSGNDISGKMELQQELKNQLKQENQQLKSGIKNILAQLRSLKDKNQKNESKIQALLKFNTKLLIIIQTSMNEQIRSKYDTFFPTSKPENNSKYKYQMESIQASLVMSIEVSDLKKREDIVSLHESYANQNIHESKAKNWGGRQSESSNPFDLQPYLKNLKNKQYLDGILEYQKLYQSYTPSQRLKEVVQLINNYRKQHGRVIEQNKATKSIQDQGQADNRQIVKQVIVNKTKISVEDDIERILGGYKSGKSKYSERTIKKLRKVLF